MAYASVTYTSASGTTFALTNSNGDPIPYIRQSDIKVYVNTVLQTLTTDYTFNTAGTAIVLNSPVSGATVLLQRITDIADPTVVYTAGSTLTAQDLNNADNQIRYGLQEFQDSVQAGGGVPDGDKGDISVGGNGTIWTVDNGAITEGKIASGAVTETKIGTGAVTSTKIADNTIVNADINSAAAIAYSKLNLTGSVVDADISASAEIAVSKLADGTARQLLQTDAAGTGVEWASNIDIPGTLDVTGNTTLDGDLTIGGSFNVTSLNGGPLAGTRNRIINGDMRIDQRAAGASATPSGGTGYFSCDRWQQWLSQNSKYSIQRSTVAPTGFTNSLLATSLSAYSVLATDNFALNQNIEGFNAADFNWGTASATSIVLSFWVRSSLTGTFGGALSNSAVSRSYPFTYTISAANTWEQKTLTIAGDTTGTWLTDNGIGIRLWFSIGAGSNYLGTAGSWAAADYRGATGQTSVVGTNGATFYITGVQLEAGTVATPFERRSYGQELSLAKRYYQLGGGLGAVYQGGAPATFSFQAKLEPEMRTAPTASIFNGTTAVVQNGRAYGNINSISLVINSTSQSVYMTVISSDTGMTANYSGEVSGRAIAFTSEL